MNDDAGLRPVFVLGAPRTGTTIVGSYIASAADVCDLGEYAGFFFARFVARREYRRTPTPYKDRYLAELRAHATDFASRMGHEAGCSAYCDATPWNLLIADELATELPGALFVLTVRHVAGVSQSLARSYAEGYEWAGATVADRARLWRDFYAHVGEMDPRRTIVLDYDSLCAAPADTLRDLDEALLAHGLRGPRDRRVLCDSRANPAGRTRPTVGRLTSDGGIELVPIPSVDRAAWTSKSDRAAHAITGTVAAQVWRFREQVAASRSPNA